MTMDGSTILPLLALGITICVNFATIAYLSGRTVTRLDIVEKSIEKLETELAQIRGLKEEIAIVKLEINHIAVTLHRLEVLLENEVNNNNNNKKKNRSEGTL